jgi:hypothetical protein
MTPNIKCLEDKTDPYKSSRRKLNKIKRKFNKTKKFWEEEVLCCNLLGDMRGIETAKESITQIDDILNSFQSFWTIEELKASKTLKETSSKCVGIANTYVALLRAMGVPSRTINGNIGNKDGLHEKGHTWATLHIPGFGWKEVDPTFGEFTDFSFDKHAYSFFSQGDWLPTFWFIGEGESNLKVNEAINLIETKRKEGIGKKDELMKKALEYLKRFQ